MVLKDQSLYECDSRLSLLPTSPNLRLVAPFMSREDMAQTGLTKSIPVAQGLQSKLEERDKVPATALSLRLVQILLQEI